MARPSHRFSPQNGDTSQRKKREREEVIDEWLELLAGGEPHLPVYLKNRAVQSLSKLNLPAFYERCKQIDACRPILTDNAIKEAVARNRPNHNGNDIFLRYATSQWRAHLPEMTLTDYEESKFTGPTAVEDFLLDLCRLRDDIQGLPEAIWTELPPSLSGLARDIEDFVQDRHGRLMTITSDEGYFASSGQFNAVFLNQLSKGTGRSLPIFYASVGRPGAAMPALSKKERLESDDPLEPSDLQRPGVTRKRMDLPTLVAMLQGFLSGTKTSPELPRSSLELWERILYIRRTLATRPALLVFDGYSAVGPSLSTLRSLLTGDPLSMLLPHLMEDWPALGNDHDSLVSELKTKIVVFSDQHPAEFDRFNPRKVEWPGKLPTGSVSKVFCDLIGSQMFKVRKFDGVTVEKRLQSAEKTIEEAMSAVTNEDTCALIHAQMNLGYAIPDFEKNSLGGSVGKFLDRLAKTDRQLELLILIFTSLSPGGLRYVTLWNLIRQWEKAQEFEATLPPEPEDTDPKFYSLSPNPTKVILQRVQTVARSLRPLLIEVRDDFIAGLDDSFRKWEYLDPPSFTDEGPAEHLATRLRLADIRSRRLREHIIGVMSAHISPMHMSRLHRLLAEELLRQHTVALRHRQNNDPLPLDSLRAVSQFLFHGWHSLAPGIEKSDRGLKPLARHIPLDPKKVYLRLYATFFKQLSAGSLHSESAARIAPVENLQLDLLQIAMNIDQMKDQEGLIFSYRRDTTEKVAITSFLDPKEPQELRLLIDQMITYGRLALHQNRFTELAKAIDFARKQLLENGGGNSLTQRHNIEYLNFQSRRLMQSADISDLNRFSEAEFRKPYAIADAIDEVIGAIRSIGGTDTLDRILEQTASVQAEKMCEGAVTPEVLRHRADLVAVYADLLWLQEEVTASADQAQVDDLLKAFIGFRIAEHIRRLAFDASPGQAVAAGDPHQVRSFVRVALRLAFRIKRFHGDNSSTLPPTDYFVREARRQNDMQTWFYGISHSDRASIHMLEAHFFRFDEAEQPEFAASALVEAERWMLPSIDRPRARKRLLFERARVASAEARRNLDKAELERKHKGEFEALSRKAKRYLKSAQADLAQIETHAQDQYWDKMRAITLRNLDELQQRVNRISPDAASPNQT